MPALRLHNGAQKVPALLARNISADRQKYFAQEAPEQRKKKASVACKLPGKFSSQLIDAARYSGASNLPEALISHVVNWSVPLRVVERVKRF
jgi:hypothetical protein